MPVNVRLCESDLILQYGEKKSDVIFRRTRMLASDADYLKAGLAITQVQGEQAQKIIRRDKIDLY